MQKLSDGQKFKLIALMRDHPEVWDSAHPHRPRNSVGAFKRIAAEMAAQDETLRHIENLEEILKSAWRVLQICFYREIKKPDSKWKFLNQMAFFHKGTRQKGAKSQKMEQNSMESLVEEDDDEEEEEADEQPEETEVMKFKVAATKHNTKGNNGKHRQKVAGTSKRQRTSTPTPAADYDSILMELQKSLADSMGGLDAMATASAAPNPSRLQDSPISILGFPSQIEMDSDLIKLEEDGVSRDHDLGDIDYAAVNADEDESVLLGKMVARAHRELKRDGLGRQAVDMEWQICQLISEYKLLRVDKHLTRTKAGVPRYC